MADINGMSKVVYSYVRQTTEYKNAEVYAKNLLATCYDKARNMISGASGYSASGYSASGYGASGYGASGSLDDVARSLFQSEFRLTEDKLRFKIAMEDYGLSGTVTLKFDAWDFVTGGDLFNGLSFNGQYKVGVGAVNANVSSNFNGDCSVNVNYNNGGSVSANGSWNNSDGFSAGVNYNCDNFKLGATANNNYVGFSFSATF